MKTVFIICPVRNANKKVQRKLAAYVADIEAQGFKVHYPARDTVQVDPSGGFCICKTNAAAMYKASEVHIWYDKRSIGSCFDIGMLFMLYATGMKPKDIVVINEDKVVDDPGKSLFKVLRELSRTHWGRPLPGLNDTQ